MTRWFCVSRHWLLIALAMLVTSGGCGSSDKGPPRYTVSGTVSFEGKPVPKGFITFLPDTSKGNKGPGGGAEIKAGSYRTATGKGVVGGPYIVKIVGYDGIATSAEGEELPDGQSLFTPYQTAVEFPLEATKQDFQVLPSED